MDPEGAFQGPMAVPALIDSHCHIVFQTFEEDLEAVAERWRIAGVKSLLHACVEPSEIPAIRSLADRFPEMRYSVGVHPLDIGEKHDRDGRVGLGDERRRHADEQRSGRDLDAKLRRERRERRAGLQLRVGPRRKHGRDPRRDRGRDRRAGRRGLDLGRQRHERRRRRPERGRRTERREDGRRAGGRVGRGRGDERRTGRGAERQRRNGRHERTTEL